MSRPTSPMQRASYRLVSDPPERISRNRIAVIGASYFISGSAAHSSLLDLIRYALPKCPILVLESSRYVARASSQTRGRFVNVTVPKMRLGSQSAMLGFVMTVQTCFRFLRELIGIRPKLLHVINMDSAIIGFVYRTIVDPRCLLAYHVMDIYAYLHATNTFLRAILLAIERFFANSASLAITVSEEFARTLGIRAPLIVYPGLTPNYEEIRAAARGGKVQPRLQKSQDEKWILCSGIVHRKRGLDKIVLLAKSLGDMVKVVCTGPVASDYRREFEALVATNVLKPVGFLDSGEYYQLVASCDYVAIPYDADEYYQFAPTYKLYEALLFRKPVIATKGTLTAKRAEVLGVGIAMDFAIRDNARGLLNKLEGNRTELLKQDHYARFAHAQISEFVRRYLGLFA